ncbi:NADPH:quinone reductase [Zooshikella ganghwensis]|uniref:NADPH:quinone reductase n=1 Tax=Zooshikella ganghwensis TaxID=202772 RepID=UPI00042360C7|nr:NADPH:quinone reductase [Zooshikella ganghwensis]
MQAIRVHQHGDTDVLQEQRIDMPQVAKSQVLIKIMAAGVNPVDTYIRAGSNNYTAQFPYTPGKDGAGTIEALGENIQHLKVGDRVYCSGSITGTCAEFALCEASQVHPLPDNITFAQGACLGTPYTTAYRALIQKAQAKPGETVLIHGASGGVGTAALQIAKAHGLKVIASAGSDSGRQLLTLLGADYVIDHHQADHLTLLPKNIIGNGINIILEMLANKNLGHDLPALAFNGRVIVIGSRGEVSINPRLLMAKDAMVIGMALFNSSPAELLETFEYLYSGLSQGLLDPVVRDVFALSDIAKAHHAVMQPGAAGNIVVTPHGNHEH